MDTPTKIEAAGKKKEEGNALFKVGKYARASKKYEKVVWVSAWPSESNGLWTFLNSAQFLCSLCFCVEQAFKFVEYDSGFDDAQKKQGKSLKVTCNLNNAACKLKLKDYKEAIKLTTKVGFLDTS